MSSLLANERHIRAEADRLLASGLRRVLDAHGEVHIVGSYALQLMTWRDLDIHIVNDRLDTHAFFALGAQVASLLSPHRMHYRDETAVHTEGLPNGLYWGVYLGDERQGAWKIDIWMTDRVGFETPRAYGERVRQALSEGTRDTILRIKSACWQHPEYRRQFSSGDIYTAVLEHDVTDVDAFRAYLARHTGSR